MDTDGPVGASVGAGRKGDQLVEVTTADGQRLTTYQSTLAQCAYFSTLFSRWGASGGGSSGGNGGAGGATVGGGAADTPLTVHVDRDSSIFRLLLDLLRYGTVDVLPDDLTRDHYAKLERDLEFFQAGQHLAQGLRVRRELLLPKRRVEVGEAAGHRPKACWKCHSTNVVKYFWACPTCRQLCTKMESCACRKDRKEGTEVSLCQECEHLMRVRAALRTARRGRAPADRFERLTQCGDRARRWRGAARRSSR